MEESRFKKALIVTLFVLFAVMVFGLFWFFFLAPRGTEALGDFGWYLFSFAAGLSMIVLPCTLPLAFVIVPLSMGKGPLKGFLIALCFGLGVAFTLSMYGVVAAVVGKVAIGSLGAPLEVVKNWLYFIAGAFAYIFALGELGLVKARMPSYTGAFPAFIQKQQDFLKALLLGLFLGNIGIGCPHPATPVILTKIAVSGSVFYGWLLFFVHAAGRVLPLIFLAVLGILGVNALQGLVKHKDKIQRATGWGMVFVAGFILVLGLFSHDWWVVSGQHTFLESITQEELFLDILGAKFGTGNAHAHELPPADHTGLFGFPVAWGTGVLLFLWILPLFWDYYKKKRELETSPPAPETPEALLKDEKENTLAQSLWTRILLAGLIIVIFGYVLPNRFLASTMADQHDEMMSGGHAMNMGGEGGMAGHAHEVLLHEEGDIRDGISISMKTAPLSPAATKNTALNFLVAREPEGTSVPEGDIEIEHEKKMHVLGVRNDLIEFFHLHPELVKDQPSTWSANHVFQKPGEYKVWSEIKYKGENHIYSHPLVKISGEGPTFELDKDLAKNKVVGRYQVALEYNALYVSDDNHVDVVVKTFDGKVIELDNYLGVKMHLAVISEDLKEFVHAHPMDGEHDMMMDMHEMDAHERSSDFTPIRKVFAHGAEEEAMPIDDATTGKDPNEAHFMVPLNAKGYYKMFAQFRPKGVGLGSDEALVAEFWVRVAEETPAALKSAPAVPIKAYMIVISLMLMTMLSVWVKKYTTV